MRLGMNRLGMPFTGHFMDGFLWRSVGACEIPRERLLKLRVGSDPNPLRERGIVLLRFTQCFGKSLADASGCDNPLCFCPLDLPQSRNAQLRNDRLRLAVKRKYYQPIYPTISLIT